MSDYVPISCAQHSEYELMAMHQQGVELLLFDSTESMFGHVHDIVTRSGVEYMALLLEDGQTSEVRLDLIKSITPIEK